jgi:hypothetical protein
MKKGFWAWKKWPKSTYDSTEPERYGELVDVLARGNGRGPRNILVRFPDGVMMVAPRFAVRRVK